MSPDIAKSPWSRTTGLIISHQTTTHTQLPPKQVEPISMGGITFPEIPVENMAKDTGVFEEA